MHFLLRSAIVVSSRWRRIIGSAYAHETRHLHRHPPQSIGQWPLTGPNDRLFCRCGWGWLVPRIETCAADIHSVPVERFPKPQQKENCRLIQLYDHFISTGELPCPVPPVLFLSWRRTRRGATTKWPVGWVSFLPINKFSFMLFIRNCFDRLHFNLSSPEGHSERRCGLSKQILGGGTLSFPTKTIPIHFGLQCPNLAVRWMNALKRNPHRDRQHNNPSVCNCSVTWLNSCKLRNGSRIVSKVERVVFPSSYTPEQ